VTLFRPAVKAQLKAKVALCGPTGSGKTWTALQWATILADGGRIAVIDTENDSASLYADRYTFDVLSWDPPYDPRKLAETIKAAVADGYACIVVDSLSHYWEGEGGTLDIVEDAASRAHGNSYAGWKIGTPALRYLIDTIRHAKVHLIATMRSSMEYILEKDPKTGKQVPTKVGMAPVMRKGVSYEFTVVGDLDEEHRLVISKSRCEELADQVAQPHRAGELAEVFAKWLSSGEATVSEAEADELTGILNGIGDTVVRTVAKQEFAAEFGKPDRLPAARFDEAKKWATTRAEAAGKTTWDETPFDEPEGEG
jgi:energy-coupling factor transporter ATP-binding protein EcfA2